MRDDGCGRDILRVDSLKETRCAHGGNAGIKNKGAATIALLSVERKRPSAVDITSTVV